LVDTYLEINKGVQTQHLRHISHAGYKQPTRRSQSEVRCEPRALMQGDRGNQEKRGGAAAAEANGGTGI
jgi:hypothetical protein